MLFVMQSVASSTHAPFSKYAAFLHRWHLPVSALHILQFASAAQSPLIVVIVAVVAVVSVAVAVVLVAVEVVTVAVVCVPVVVVVIVSVVDVVMQVPQSTGPSVFETP
jgi:hypothetical protein